MGSLCGPGSRHGPASPRLIPADSGRSPNRAQTRFRRLSRLSAVCSLLSRALNRSQPLWEPSLYALYGIASNLDFSSRKLQGLFAAGSEEFVDSFAGPA